MLFLQFCRVSFGVKGRCCLPASAPQPPQRQQIICNADSDCVSPGLCGDDGFIITDGSGLIDPRITSQQVSQYTPGSPANR